MLQRYRKIIGLATAVIVMVILLATVFAPAKPVAAVDCGVEGGTFFDWGCGGQGKDSSNIGKVLLTILNILAGGVIIAVIGGVIYGAIMYTSAGGNTEQTKKALGFIRNSIIALILYFMMYSFLNFLIPDGLFS
jgi:hypothetical protein